MQKHLIRTVLFAGLVAAGAAYAQNTTVMPPSTEGQASTESRSGVPNPTQRPQGGMPASRESVKAEARMQNKNPANTMTPSGEASTKINNQPNMTPQPVSGTTRAEVRQETLKTKPRFGDKGEKTNVPTNPKDGTKGTPE